MTELDKALISLNQDKRNPENQSLYYDLFLNSEFYIPTIVNTEGKSDEPPGQPGVPLVVESEGHDYLVFFDTKERLFDWAQEEVTFLVAPGHVIAETSTHPLHWILNLGTDYSKVFVPDEIDWLKEAVATCKREAGDQKDSE